MDVSVADPLLGQVLDGRYEVRSRIARGGMATVYLALDRRLERDVALKVMRADLAEDGEFLGRFTREARAAARLNHPSVVQVFDQGTHEDVVFLAMEHVPGCTLRDLLAEQAPLPVGETLDLLEPVLQALSVAHRAGVVHRDVKPENVLIGEQGQVKVADFGLASTVDSTHSSTGPGSGAVLGTVAYLAPEQVERGVADSRSDVYAAGVMLFEMVTGAKPFAGETAVQVALQHVSGRVPAPSSRTAGVPTAVDELVALATARDPDDRPADAAALLEALRTTRRRLTRPQLEGRTTPPAAVRHHTVALDAAELRAALAGSSEPEIAADGPQPPARPGGRGPVLLLLVVLAAVLLGVGGWYLGLGPGGALPSAQVRRDQSVPAVVGQPEQQARDSLRARNLEAAPVVERFDQDVPAGSVISVDPAAGAAVRAGSAVRLVVSRGPEPVALPNWSGRPLADARPSLAASGLKVDVAERYHATIARGLVISQSPRRGTAHRGDTIALTVSRGPKMVVVPRVVGRQVREATERLQARGFTVKVHKVLGGYFGSVRSQRPGAGQDAPEASTVTLTVI